jgi:outer membrane receptor protein involved in Fe transport
MGISYRFLLVILVLLSSGILYSQTYELSGKVQNVETGEPIQGAEISLTPGTMKTLTDNTGYYIFSKIGPGTYIIKVKYLGYEIETREVTVNSNVTSDFALKSGTITTDELIVEINRAKERETPVAFSTVDAKRIDQKIHGQDAPMIVKGIPGMYSYSTDGVGNGEGQLLVRGFSQNYVQVLINGIPTNDPESNSVYWSNWGSVSSNAGSIQVQRGAGSSLYGSGSFGGSFNVITENPGMNHFYGANLSLGDPKNYLYGIKVNTGLFLKKKFAFAFNVDRKIAEGNRISGRYEGINYYSSLSFFPNPKQSIKLVLHGAPQEHGYSFSNHVVYFKKFGYKANSAPFLPKEVVDLLPFNKTNGLPNYGLNDNTRELVDDKFVNLSHNHFHKPQAELHYSFDVNQKSKLMTTLFYSLGRGGGSSINSAGNVFSFTNRTKNSGMNGYRIDTLTTNYYGSQGYVNTVGVADTIYLKNAFQRDSYSLHRQFGILSSYTTEPVKNLKVTAGAEFRSWFADHPGHFTNLFGKTRVTQSYSFRDTTGKVSSSTFSRYVYQGDIEGPEDDAGFDIFGWELSKNDPSYKSQYRNYSGDVPQITIFAQGNYQLNKLNFMGSFQYVWYKYTLKENMPSESSIGQQLTLQQAQELGLTGSTGVADSTKEGPDGSGKFYMLGSNKKWYSFDLINADRSRGFIQPKFGINYNATKNFNVFANFAHVERFIDLSVYYNQGLLNPDAKDEKSNQFELGLGWTSDWINAKLNGYYMLWDNKVARIQDVSKAGFPGYDRNGFRSELVGTSRHMGGEFEFNMVFDRWFSIKGFGIRGAATLMNNTWTKVLDEVKTLTDASGKILRRPFNTGAFDENGNTDTLYFDELEGTHVASGPQFMLSAGLNFSNEKIFGGIDMHMFDRFFLLDGDTYQPVDAERIGVTSSGKEIWNSKYDNQLPSAFTFDFYAGYNFNLAGYVKGTASVQVMNIFDKDYFSAVDRFGVIPGQKRTVRFNISLGY